MKPISSLNRRQFLQAMMAGVVVVAGELWMPGEKLISIPGQHIIYGADFSFNPSTQVISVLKRGPSNRATIMDLYKFIVQECPGQVKGLTMLTSIHNPSADITLDEARVDNPEFIRAGNGSLTQGNDLYVGVQSASVPGSQDPYYLINGTKAVHPGPIDQLVPANLDTKIQVRAEPDRNGQVQRFQQIYAQKGANVVWPNRLYHGRG